LQTDTITDCTAQAQPIIVYLITAMKITHLLQHHNYRITQLSKVMFKMQPLHAKKKF